MGDSRQKSTGSYQQFDGIVVTDSVVLDEMSVDNALERDEADNFHPKSLRRLRNGLILIMIVSAGSWAIIFQVARIVFQ